MTSRVCVNVVRLAIVLFSLLLDAGFNFAAAQTKLDAAYTATLFGLPIGQISWTVELRGNRFTAAANGAISGLLRIFSDGRGDVAAHGTLPGGQPVASDFALKLAAGKWSDEVRIVFRGDKAKEYVANAPAKPDPNQVPLTDANRIGVVDPMTAMFVRIPGTGETTVPEACERTVAVFDGHTRYNLRLASSGSTRSKQTRAIKVPSWCAQQSSSRWRGSIPNVTSSRIWRHNTTWKYGWRPLPAADCWCHTGCQFLRRWDSGCYKRRNSSRFPQDRSPPISIEMFHWPSDVHLLLDDGTDAIRSASPVSKRIEIIELQTSNAPFRPCAASKDRPAAPSRCARCCRSRCCAPSAPRRWHRSQFKGVVARNINGRGSDTRLRDRMGAADFRCWRSATHRPAAKLPGLDQQRTASSMLD